MSIFVIEPKVSCRTGGFCLEFWGGLWTIEGVFGRVVLAGVAVLVELVAD